jgi:hypothetical protein
MVVRASIGALVAAAFGLSPAAASEWEWVVAPYAWLTDVSTDFSINDQDVLENEVDVEDILDDLDFSLQMRVEGQRGRNGVFLDFSYFDFGDDDKTQSLPNAPGSVLVIKGDLEQTFIDAGGIYNPRGDGRGFALLYGARIIDVDEELDIRVDTPTGSTPSRRVSGSGTLYDGLVAVRYMGQLGERWLYLAAADASTGGSEFTWGGVLDLGYRLGQRNRYTLVAGYRYLKIELREDDVRAEVESRLTMSGPHVGLVFRF